MRLRIMHVLLHGRIGITADQTSAPSAYVFVAKVCFYLLVWRTHWQNEQLPEIGFLYSGSTGPPSSSGGESPLAAHGCVRRHRPQTEKRCNTANEDKRHEPFASRQRSCECHRLFRNGCRPQLSRCIPRKSLKPGSSLLQPCGVRTSWTCHEHRRSLLFPRAFGMLNTRLPLAACKPA